MTGFLKSRTCKAIILGLAVGLLGLASSPFPFVRNLEEDLGLGLLFRTRGEIQPPSEAVVISIDKESSDALGVPNNPDKWPRSLHARITEVLARAGARVVAFDVHFKEPRTAEDDAMLAAAIESAGNVILTESLEIHEIPLSEENRDLLHNVVTITRPIDLLADAARTTVPFTLPRIPFKVNQYWTFQRSAGDSPTVPVIANQIYCIQAYGGFIRLLEEVYPEIRGRFLPDGATAMHAESIKKLVMDIRSVFEGNPRIEEKMIGFLETAGDSYGDATERKMIRSLVRMYCGAGSRYVNYYGPPGTVKTIPFHKALQLENGGGATAGIDLRDKAVFVGLSEVLLAERKDSFYTVFSQANGTFIGGVEIMATAFLNLLSDTPLKPAGYLSFLLVVLLWGVLLGCLCRGFSVWVSALAVLLLSGLYFLIVLHLFASYSVWYPIMVPLFLQAPMALVGGIVWNYVETNKERKNIRKAFTHYLPKDQVDRLAKDITHIQADSQVVHGVCLFTDAQHYTTISETMDPQELGQFMNRYYETMFKPVKDHDGAVSGITGDAMLALWVSAKPDNLILEKACLAALDINRELERYMESSDTVKIKTRIGLHCGQILLGSVGALDHYEYTPMGDIVNTASRIEGLNKYMGTAVMVSEEVLGSLQGFLTRELGRFRLKGKIKPVAVHELICRIDEADQKQHAWCLSFAEALEAFRKRLWDEAEEKFRLTREALGEDKASQFYLDLCEEYRNSPPEESWNGVVSMEQK